MKVRVRLFAVARQLACADSVEVELPSESRLGALRAALSAQFPALAPVVPQVLFAIGSEYVHDGTILPDGAEVACIPPVSGG